MIEYHIKGIQLRNPGHVLACLGALRLVTKAGVDTARGTFIESPTKDVEFVLSAVSGILFVKLIRALSIGSEDELRGALELPNSSAIGGKDTLLPVLLKGKWTLGDQPIEVQFLLQGWLEPCSRYGGRTEKKHDDMRKKSPLKFFAGKSTPESVLKPMIEGLRCAGEFNPERILCVQSGGTAQFNW